MFLLSFSSVNCSISTLAVLDNFQPPHALNGKMNQICGSKINISLHFLLGLFAGVLFVYHQKEILNEGLFSSLILLLLVTYSASIFKDFNKLLSDSIHIGTYGKSLFPIHVAISMILYFGRETRNHLLVDVEIA